MLLKYPANAVLSKGLSIPTETEILACAPEESLVRRNYSKVHCDDERIPRRVVEQQQQRQQQEDLL